MWKKGRLGTERRRELRKNSQKGKGGALSFKDLKGVEVESIGASLRMIVPGLGPICVVKNSEFVFDENGKNPGKKQTAIIVQHLKGMGFLFDSNSLKKATLGVGSGDLLPVALKDGPTFYIHTKDKIVFGSDKKCRLSIPETEAAILSFAKKFIKSELR